MAESTRAVAAGAFAGLAVDLTLFPLDTIKTRLQARGGFFANGGYRGVYNGMGSIAAGSAPGAALFFLSYEALKKSLPIRDNVLLAVISGSLAESLACLIRVPTEVIKQRAQTTTLGSWHLLRRILATDGLSGLYRGFGGTLAREIPFVAIQFPLWEALKRAAVRERGASLPHEYKLPEASPAEAAICGAIAGGIAAALTTPMDVVKTRLMLSQVKIGWFAMVAQIVRTEGVFALTRGMLPRVGWISAGGFIFLGGYSFAKERLERLA